MVTTTTTYSFKKPTVADDEDVWGGYLNETIDLIDDVLDGTTPVTGIDINSGTIDNVVIGGTTAAAGSFTSVTIEGSNVVFEGATADDFETTLTVTDPTADRTITFPDESGTIPLIDSSGHLIVENADPELHLISTDSTESFLKLRKNIVSDAWDMQIDGSDAETGSSFEIAIDGSSVSSQNVTSGVSKTIIKDLLQVQGQDLVNDDANLEVNAFFGAAELSVYSGGSTSKIGIGTATPAVSLDIATTDAIQVPDGTTAQRPASPANGMFRYSTTDNQFEGYINGAWGAVGGGGNTFDSSIIFEGATADAFETTLTVTDPTADRTFTLPDATGTAAIITTAGVLENESHTATLKLNSTNSGESRIELKSFQFGGFGFDLWDFEVDPSDTENNTILNFKVDGETIAVMSGTQYSGEKTLTVTNLGVGGDIIFEGSTSDAFETTLTVTDPTADRTITLPDATGNVAVFSTAPTTAIADGTSGQFLTTNGSGVLSFADAGGGDDDAVSVTKSGSTYTLDLSAGHNFYTAADVSTDTFALSNIPTTSFEGKVEIQYVGGAITWPTEFEWVGGSAPSLLSGRDHLFEFNKIRSSSNIKVIHHGPYDYTGSTTFPTFVGQSKGTSVNGGSYTVSLSGLSIAADDVAVLVAATEHSSLEPTIQSSGWTSAVVVEANDSYDARMAVYYKVLTGTETGVTVNSTGDSGASAAGVLMVFRGVDTTTPLDVTPTSNTTTNSGIPEFVSVTGSSNDVGKLLIAAASTAHTRSTTADYTVSDGLYEEFLSESSNDSGDITVGMGYQLTAGASVTVTPPDFTWSPSDNTAYSASTASIILRGAS